MKALPRIGGAVLLALVLHLTLGWAWTPLAGLLAGWHMRGWIFGALVVGVDYGLLVAFSFAVDPRAVGTMTDTMGGFLGNMPSGAVVALTVLIGVVLGGLSGAAGAQGARLVKARRRTHRAT